MIRCNNCGWFNPDTATHCEMCEEELTGQPVENLVEQTAANTTGKPDISPNEEKTKVQPVGNTMLETVRFAAAPDSRAKNFSATVMDASSILDHSEPLQCPKCRYPVSGYTETCPNCGTSLKKLMKETVLPSSPAMTVKESVEEPEEKAPVQDAFKGTVREAPLAVNPASGQGRRAPKATVREIPKELISDEAQEDAWRLIPVDSPDPEILVIHPGEIVAIGNRRYKFQK